MSYNFAPITVKGFEPEARARNRVREVFNDLRLSRNWKDLVELMWTFQSLVVHQISTYQSELYQYYRLLKNKRVRVEETIQQGCKLHQPSLKGRHVLVIGDTTSISLKDQKGRIKDAERIGVLEDNKTPGFYNHANLVVDADNQNIYGLSDYFFWTRPQANADTKTSKGTRRTDEDSEEKESQKWLLGVNNSGSVIGDEVKKTYVFDRQADDYQEFVGIKEQANAGFIIRCKHNRIIIWQDKKLKIRTCLPLRDVLGTLTIELPALDHYSSTKGERVKRAKRTAILELRACQVIVPLPAGVTQGESIMLWAVWAKEVTPNLPSEEEPIDWVLWTTLPADTFEQALSVIRFYTLRWIIEQLFRTLKTEGLDIEGTELESFDAILKLTSAAMITATRALQLVYARHSYDAQPIEQVFDSTEQTVLRKLNQQFQGTTEKQRNPFPPSQLSWAAWVIARLGGWKGYRSQRPPGPITMVRGLKIFAVYVQAFQVFANDA